MYTIGSPEVNDAFPAVDEYVPASSPLLDEIDEFVVRAFIIEILTTSEYPVACAFMAVFVYGSGVLPPDPSGVLHTSGKAMPSPTPRFAAGSMTAPPQPRWMARPLMVTFSSVRICALFD